MKFSAAKFLRFASLLLVLLLAACGGGGSSTESSPSAQTRAQAQAVAGLGLIVAESLFFQVQLEQSFFGNYIAAYSATAASGSSGPIVTLCAGSGSITTTVSKAGQYVGLRTNDTIELAFNACTDDPSLLLNGNAVLVSKGDYASLGTNFVVEYTLNTSYMDFSFDGIRTSSSSTQDVKFDTRVDGANFPEITATVLVPSSLAYYTPTSATTPYFAFALTNPTFFAKQTPHNTFINKLDGEVTVISNAGAVPLSFTTVTPLSGAVVFDYLEPSGGVLRVREASSNMLTETAINGSLAKVKADSNGDGVFDFSFDIGYIDLITF
jgi:hypothetical protein